MYNVCDDNMICIYSYEILLFYYSDVITFITLLLYNKDVKRAMCWWYLLPNCCDGFGLGFTPR